MGSIKSQTFKFLIDELTDSITEEEGEQVFTETNYDSLVEEFFDYLESNNYPVMSMTMGFSEGKIILNIIYQTKAIMGGKITPIRPADIVS